MAILNMEVAVTKNMGASDPQTLKQTLLKSSVFTYKSQLKDHQNERLISLNFSLHIWTLQSTVVTTFTTYFTTKKLRTLPTDCIYGFCMTLTKERLVRYIALND